MAAIGVRPGRELTRGKMADRPGVQPRAPCIHTASVNVIVTTDDVTDTNDTIYGMHICVLEYFAYLWLLYSINACDWESAQNNDDADDAHDVTNIFVVKSMYL